MKERQQKNYSEIKIFFQRLKYDSITWIKKLKWNMTLKPPKKLVKTKGSPYREREGEGWTEVFDFFPKEI